MYSPANRILCRESAAGENSRRIVAGRYESWISGEAGWTSARVPRTNADVCVVKQKIKQQRRSRERNRDLGLKLSIQTMLQIVLLTRIFHFLLRCNNLSELSSICSSVQGCVSLMIENISKIEVAIAGPAASRNQGVQPEQCSRNSHSERRPAL